MRNLAIIAVGKATMGNPNIGLTGNISMNG